MEHIKDTGILDCFETGVCRQTVFYLTRQFKINAFTSYENI